MKKILIIIWILFIIFLWLNYNNIKNFYYNFSGVYKKADNLEWKYNLWKKLYEEKKYNELINSFSWVLSEDKSEINFRSYYLLWNSFYKNSEIKSENKINLLEKSIENYEKALLIKFDEQVQKNLEFVTEKLRIAKLEEEKKKQEEQNKLQNEIRQEDKQWQSNNNKEENWQKTNDKQEWKWQNESGQNVQQNDKKWETWKWQDEWLSEETKKILEQRVQELKNQQGDIWEFYNKVYKENIDPFNQFDEFFNNPFFDNSLLEKKDEKKDW